jgi:hypothetical protein
MGAASAASGTANSNATISLRMEGAPRWLQDAILAIRAGCARRVRK